MTDTIPDTDDLPVLAMSKHYPNAAFVGLASSQYKYQYTMYRHLVLRNFMSIRAYVLDVTHACANGPEAGKYNTGPQCQGKCLLEDVYIFELQPEVYEKFIEHSKRHNLPAVPGVPDSSNVSDGKDATAENAAG